jgi:hypothetical protein
MEEINNEIKEGSNILILDGPIGRLKFLQTALAVALYNFVVSSVATSYENQGININIYLFLGLNLIFCFIIPFYISTIYFIKRMYDIVGNKAKAIFYYFLYIITAISFILLTVFVTPIFNIATAIVAFSVALLLLFKKGHLINHSEQEKEYLKKVD